MRRSFDQEPAPEDQQYVRLNRINRIPISRPIVLTVNFRALNAVTQPAFHLLFILNNFVNFLRGKIPHLFLFSLLIKKNNVLSNSDASGLLIKLVPSLLVILFVGVICLLDFGIRHRVSKELLIR